MKRVLSLVLVLMLVLTSIMPAFAEEPAVSTETADLQSYGVVAGDGTGANEAGPLTRAAMTVLLAKLYGEQAIAEGYEMPGTFEDLEGIWSGYVPYINYAKAQGWMVGDNDTTFRPMDIIKAQEMNSLLLRALGYDIAWADVNAKAEELGIAVVAADASLVLRGEAFKAIRTALDVMPMDAEVTLGSQLELANYVAPVVEPEVPEVTSVENSTLKTIVVKFSEEIDKDTVKASATATSADTVRLYDANGNLVNVTTSLGQDKMTLTVVKASGTFAQFAQGTLVVDGVKSLEEVAVTKSETALTFKDNTQPTVLGATATSMKTIEITFSEPVTGLTDGTSQVWSQFKLAGINTYATMESTNVDTTNTVSITLGTKLTAGDHELTISGINDYAGYPITSTTLTVTVADDSTAPVVTSVEYVDNSTIKVNFNEPVDATTAGTPANYEVNDVVVTSATKVDDDTYTLVLATPLNLGHTLSAKLETKGIKDNNDNKSADWVEFAFVAEDDAVVPTATVAITSTNDLEVTFSENVTGVATGDFTVKNASGTAVVVTGATAKVISGVTSKSVYTVTLTDAASLSGNYTVEIAAAAVNDLGVRALPNAKATFTVTANDKVAPEVSSALFTNETTNAGIVDDSDAYDAKVVIYFTEAMDAATLTNGSNYILGGVVLADESRASIAAAGDGKSVTITINDNTNNYDFTTATSLKLLALKDVAGNTLKSTQLNVSLGSGAGNLALLASYNATPTFAQAVDTTKIELVGTNQVKLYRAGSYLFSGMDPNKIHFSEGTTNVATGDLLVTGVSIAADGKTAVLTLNKNVGEDMKYDGTDAGTGTEALDIYVEAEAITLTDGSKTQAVVVGSGVALVDKVAPTVKSIAVKEDPVHADNNKIVITYNEAIDMNASFLYDIVVKDLTASATLTPSTDFTVAEVADTVEITIIKNGVAGHKFSVEIVNGRYIDDVANNVAAANAVATVTNKAGDADGLVNEKVSVTATAAAGATLVLTYNEALYIGGTAVADGTDIKAQFSAADGAGGAAAIAITSATYDATAKTVTFVLANLEDADTITVAGTLTDAAGNSVDATKDVATYTLGTTTWALN